MADKKRAELEKKLEKLAEEQQQAEQALEQLRRDEAKEIHASVSTTLNEYAGHFTTAQRNQLIRILEEKSAGGKKSGAVKKVAPKYEAGGVKWTGRGHVPTQFKEWEKTPAGKAFRKENPKGWPLIKGQKK